MEFISNDIITVLSYLLPGFVAAWIFYGLTSYPEPDTFGRIIHALILNLFIQVGIIFIRFISLLLSKFIYIGEWSKNTDIVLALICAIVIGLLFSRLANNDWLHRILRKFNFTKQTSFPSEWFGALSQNKSYVVLHLSGERRIYGWPIEWPSQPDSGHFCLVEAEWLLEDNKTIPLAGVDKIIIPTTEVIFIETMQ